jgi:hypothetical protein
MTDETGPASGPENRRENHYFIFFNPNIFFNTHHKVLEFEFRIERKILLYLHIQVLKSITLHWTSKF